MNITRNRLVAGILVAVGLTGSIVFGTQSNASTFDSPDCSSNSIVKCGVPTIASLRQKYAQSRELQTLFGHFGWTSADINGNIVPGTADNKGNIVVNGKVVATGARSVGRNNTNPSCSSKMSAGGRSYYIGSTACRFKKHDTVTAWVMLNKDGQFVGAINKACANPLPATPVAPPKPAPTPTYACNALTATAVTKDDKSALTYNFATNASAANGAVIKSYVYDFGDGTGTTTSENHSSHTYAKAGTYTVTVTVNVTVNGKDVTTTSEACKTVVKPVEAPKKIQVCRLSDYTIVTITESEFDQSKYSKDLEDCKKVQVCDTTTKQIVTVTKEEAKDSKYTTDMAACQPTPETPQTPETPTPVELPRTGANDTIASIFGAGSLIAAAYYYIASRRING